MLCIVAHLSVYILVDRAGAAAVTLLTKEIPLRLLVEKKADVTMDSKGCRNQNFDNPVTCHDSKQTVSVRRQSHRVCHFVQLTHVVSVIHPLLVSFPFCAPSVQSLGSLQRHQGTFVFVDFLEIR